MTEVILRNVEVDDHQLPLVIKYSIGNPSYDKILETLKSYKGSGHEVVGAFTQDILIGVIVTFKVNKIITIKRISVLKEWRRQGIGALLLGNIKKRYTGYIIVAETDENSVEFYAKAGFVCNEFRGQYGNMRYKCEFS